jgi:hypothetical protein
MPASSTFVITLKWPDQGEEDGKWCWVVELCVGNQLNRRTALQLLHILSHLNEGSRLAFAEVEFGGAFVEGPAPGVLNPAIALCVKECTGGGFGLVARKLSTRPAAPLRDSSLLVAAFQSYAPVRVHTLESDFVCDGAFIVALGGALRAGSIGVSELRRVRYEGLDSEVVDGIIAVGAIPLGTSGIAPLNPNNRPSTRLGTPHFHWDFSPIDTRAQEHHTRVSTLLPSRRRRTAHRVAEQLPEDGGDGGGSVGAQHAVHVQLRQREVQGSFRRANRGVRGGVDGSREGSHQATRGRLPNPLEGACFLITCSVCWERVINPLRLRSRINNLE